VLVALEGVVEGGRRALSSIEGHQPAVGNRSSTIASPAARTPAWPVTAARKSSPSRA